MLIAEYIVKTLRDFGCSTFFGIPGSLIMPIWQEAGKHNLITCTSEGDASYIANGFAKGSKKLTAVITTACPGVTNVITGIASSNKDSSAIIYISGVAPIKEWGTGTRQEESNKDRAFISSDLMKPVCKYSILLDNPKEVAERFINCCNIALTNRKGVVHVSIPIDVQLMEMPSRVDVKIIHEDNVPFEDINIQTDPQRPLIIIGWGTYLADCIDIAYSIGDKIAAPILVTSKGMVCERYNHPFFLGKLGFGYNKTLHKFLSDYKPDYVYIIGSSVGAKDFSPELKGVLEDAKCYLFSCENDSIGQRLPTCNFVQVESLKPLLSLLLMRFKYNPNRDYILSKISLCKKKQSKIYMSSIRSHDVMALSICTINDIAVKESVIIADAGNHLLDAQVIINPFEENHYFADFGIRAMGNGICTSIGLAIANPGMRYICITGDGSMLMNGNSIYLAAKYNLPIIFIVFNNGTHGRVRVGQMKMNSFVGSTLGGIDFCIYARAFGIDANKVYAVTDLRELLSSLLNTTSPHLIEVTSSKDEIPIALR